MLYIDGVPAALTAIINKPDEQFEVADFYVVPYFRQNKIGKRFVSQVFANLGGRWEIKQVAGADHAVKFWRDVLTDYTKGNFTQDSYQDEVWGLVTRQIFRHSDEI